MKRFIEEYGLAVFAAIVIITLIFLVTPFGGSIRKFIKEELVGAANVEVDTYKEQKLEYLDLSIEQNGYEGNFIVSWNTTKLNQFYDIYYKIKDEKGWGPLTYYSEVRGPVTFQTGRTNEEEFIYQEEIFVPIYNGQSLEVHVWGKTDNSNDKYTSNIVIYKNPLEPPQEDGLYNIFYRNVGFNYNENPTTYRHSKGYVELKPINALNKTWKGWYLNAKCVDDSKHSPADPGYNGKISSIDKFSDKAYTLFACWYEE